MLGLDASRKGVGRAQEERTREASTARAEGECVERPLEGKKSLQVRKPIHDLGLTGAQTFAFNSGSAPTLAYACPSAQVGGRFSLSSASPCALCPRALQAPLRVLCAPRDLGWGQGQAGARPEPEGLHAEATPNTHSLPLSLPAHWLGWGQERAREGETRGSGKVAVEAALNPGLLCGWKYPLHGSWPWLSRHPLGLVNEAGTLTGSPPVRILASSQRVSTLPLLSLLSS